MMKDTTQAGRTLCEMIAVSGPTGVHASSNQQYYELTPVTIHAKCLSCRRCTVLGTFTYCVRDQPTDAYASKHEAVRREGQDEGLVSQAQSRLVENNHGSH